MSSCSKIGAVAGLVAGIVGGLVWTGLVSARWLDTIPLI